MDNNKKIINEINNSLIIILEAENELLKMLNNGDLKSVNETITLLLKLFININTSVQQINNNLFYNSSLIIRLSNTLKNIFEYYQTDLSKAESDVKNILIPLTKDYKNSFELDFGHENNIGMMKSYSKKIAYCIPTYNRSELIQELLGRLLPLLSKHDIDLYIYDSSSDNLTESNVKKYSSYKNLYYIDLPPETNQIKKLGMIFTGEGQVKEYDYVWLVKDRVYWSEDLIERVCEQIVNNPDAIFLRAIETKHTMNLRKTHYDNIIEFYHDWAWLVTSWDCLLMSRQNILSKVNWDKIIERYTIDNDISFIPAVLLFDTLSENEICDIPILDARNGLHNFSLPLSKPKSNEMLFMTWGRGWHYLNMNLPDIYDKEKKFVIKSAASLPWIIGSYMRIINIWKSGSLTDNDVEPVKDIWNDLTDVSWEDMCRIKNNDMEFIEKCIVDSVWKAIEENDLTDIQYNYYSLSWIRDNVKSHELLNTIYAMDIYTSEVNNNNVHIFDGGHTKEFVFEKIEMVIKLLNILENNEGFKSEQIRQCIKQKLISSTMLVYLIAKTCSNTEIVIERLIDFLCEN